MPVRPDEYIKPQFSLRDALIGVIDASVRICGLDEQKKYAIAFGLPYNVDQSIIEELTRIYRASGWLAAECVPVDHGFGEMHEFRLWCRKPEQVWHEAVADHIVAEVERQIGTNPQYAHTLYQVSVTVSYAMHVEEFELMRERVLAELERVCDVSGWNRIDHQHVNPHTVIYTVSRPPKGE